MKESAYMATENLVAVLNWAIEHNVELDFSMICDGTVMSFSSYINDFETDDPNEVIIYCRNGVMVEISAKNLRYDSTMNVFDCPCEGNENVNLSITI